MAQSLGSTSFDTVADLRNSTGENKAQVSVLGLTAFDDSNGGNYMWSDSETGADNGFTIIKATNSATGRWKRLPNSNTVKGSSTFSSVTLQTAYVVPHNLPFTPLQVYIQPRTVAAAVVSWVSNINSTSFTVNFATVPIVGTLNITIDWLIIKQ